MLCQLLPRDGCKQREKRMNNSCHASCRILAISVKIQGGEVFVPRSKALGFTAYACRPAPKVELLLVGIFLCDHRRCIRIDRQTLSAISAATFCFVMLNQNEFDDRLDSGVNRRPVNYRVREKSESAVKSGFSGNRMRSPKSHRTGLGIAKSLSENPRAFKCDVSACKV